MSQRGLYVNANTIVVVAGVAVILIGQLLFATIGGHDHAHESHQNDPLERVLHDAAMDALRHAHMTAVHASAAPTVSVAGQAPAPGGLLAHPAAARLPDSEYCRQVALATLASCLIEASHNEFTFRRDLTRPESAIEQFAETFGEAIRYRTNPRSTGAAAVAGAAGD